MTRKRKLRWPPQALAVDDPRRRDALLLAAEVHCDVRTVFRWYAAPHAVGCITRHALEETARRLGLALPDAEPSSAEDDR